MCVCLCVCVCVCVSSQKQNMLDEIRALTAQQRSIVNKLVEENQQLHAQLKQLHLEKGQILTSQRSGQYQ